MGGDARVRASDAVLAAGAAATDEREVVGVDLEVGLLTEALLHAAEHVVGEVHDRAASLAHRVVVEPIGEVVDGPSVAQVDVGDDAEAL